jgi:hypothetical protein
MQTMPIPTQIRLAWNKTQYFGGDNEEHVQYLIYGDTVDGNQGNLLHVANYTEMMWDHNGLTPGSVWYYTLKVRNRAHTYSVGTGLTLRALGCPAPSTSLPALLSAYSDAILLTWAKGNLFTEDQKGYDYDYNIRYRVYHNSSLLTNYSVVHIWTSPDHNTTSFNHTGLEQKQSYGYFVSIENSVCESSMSQEIVYQLDSEVNVDVSSTLSISTNRRQLGEAVSSGIITPAVVSIINNMLGRAFYAATAEAAEESAA